jgi:hypothetical protein
MVTKNRRLVRVSERKKRFLALLDAAHDRIKKTGGVRHEDFWKAVGKKDKRTPR